MVLHPDIQARAQAEIDTVVGGSRLPDFKDRPDMPYVEAILTETLRWIPVTPLSTLFPHHQTETGYLRIASPSSQKYPR